MMSIIKPISNRIKTNEFAKSVISIGSGKIIAQAISVITIPILSRIYDPSVFGDQQIIVSVASIILSFVNLGLGSAIMAMETEDKAKSLFMTCSILMAGISLVCIAFIAGICNSYRVLNVSNSNGIEYIILWFYIFMFNLQTNLSILANRMEMNRLLFANPIICSLCNLIIAIPLGLFGYGYYGLMSASVLGISIAVAQMSVRLKPLVKGYNGHSFICDIRLNKAYVIFQCPAGIIGSLAQQLPTQTISRTYSSTILGNYSMCVNLVNYPITLIGNPIGTAYFRKATECMKQGEEGLSSLSDFTYKIVRNVILLSIIPVLVYILFGEKIVTIILGDAWKLAGKISTILIYPYVLYFCSMCTAYCRVSIRKQKLNLLVTISKIILVAIAFAIGIFAGWSFEKVMLLYAISFAVSNVIDVGLNFVIMKRNFGKFMGLVGLSSILTTTFFLLTIFI